MLRYMATKKREKRLFGTNGVRGIVGKDLTPALMITIGEALGTMRKGRIAVGRDTRTTGEMLIKAIKSGLLATGCDVVDCGILPTPALQYLVKEQFDAGAMITASHNPPEYNGVKIIESDGTEMGDEETLTLEDMIFDRLYSINSWDQTVAEESAPHLIEHYITAVVSHFPNRPGTGMKVVVDPGSGPACLTTPRILEEIGCSVLTINGTMDGTFPGRMPEPSHEGLKGLAALVVSSGAAFGIAHDGDADRAVFIDEAGHFVEENQEFALVTQHVCHHHTGILVTPVSTGQIVEMVANQEGCRVVYTPVGSIYVARTMRSFIEQGESVVFGGEGNGGLIFPNHQFCRDGGMTAAMMVFILSSTGIKLSKLIDALPKRHIIKEKIATLQGKKILSSLAIEYSQDQQDQTDGLKIIRDKAWGLVRASGTEPIIRIIVDAESKDYCQKFYHELMNQIEKITEKQGT